jgi:predicted transcriptional regulator
MSPTHKDKQEMRVIIDKETYRLLKKLAGVRELSMSRMAEEAFDRYLEDEDIKELIDRHKLDLTEEGD